MLEYGINFNTKDGAAKAQKELEALHKRWQKIFDEAPLTVKFSKIDFDKLVRSGSMNKIAKDAQSIGEQIRKMRAEFRGLTVDEARAGAGSNIIERYRKLKAEAGIYAGTLDQAVKAQDRLAAESDKATGAIRRQNREFKKQSEVLTQLKSYAMNFLSVYAGIRMIKNLATITGEFEMQKTSIQAILQDAEKGAAIFERIKKLAVISPFQFKDLISYTKQLSAFSVPYEELYDTTKMLADLSAGLGVSMERLILAYGQVRSAAVLRGQELRQFTEAGIPIVEELRQKLSEANGELVTTGEVFDYISARKVPFEMVRDIIVEMTSEGGKFYKMQEVQAETLKGKIANLTDAFQIMMANIGEKDGGLMKGAVDGIRALIENYETVGGILGTLVATYGAYKASLIAANTAELIMNGTYVAKIRILRAAVVAQRALNAAMMVNPYVLLATAVTGLATAFVLLRDKTTAAEKAQKRFNDTLAETQELADKERAKITELVNAVKDETRTRRDRQLKIEELQRLYPDIFSNLDLETAKNFELAKAIGEVNKELEAKSDAQMQERVVEITKELTRLRSEHGTTAYAGMYKYTIDHAERINELESERALITGKIAENEAAAAAAANQTLAEWQKIVDSFVEANDASFLKYSGEDGTAFSYISRIRDEYKRLTDEYSTYSTLVDSGSKKQAQRLKEQIALTEQLAKTMGFSLGDKDTSDKERREAERRVKEYLDSIQKQVDEYRKKFDIWNTIYNASGKKPKIDFDITFDGDPDITKYIKAKMQEIGKGKLNLDVNFLTANFEDILDGALFDDQTIEKLRALFNELRDSSFRDYKGLTELYEQYADYTIKKSRLDKKYIEERNKLLRSGASEAVLKEQIRVYREESEKLMMEFANKDKAFNEFVTSLANHSVDKLRFLLMELKASLTKETVTGGDQETILMLRAQITALEERLKTAKVDTQTKDVADAYKQWRNLQSVLRRVGKSFDEIGNSVSGISGEIISLAGDITTSTLSMINGITTLANWSIQATKATAEGTSKAIQDVEKASVILDIISAALQAATKIWDFISRTDELSEEKIEQYRALIKVTNEVIDSQKRLIATMSGSEARKEQEETLRLLEKQEEAARNLGKEYMGSGSGLFKHSYGVRMQRNLKKYAEDFSKIGIDYDSLGRRLTGLFDLTPEQLKNIKKEIPGFWAGLTEDARSYLEQIIETGEKTKDLGNITKEAFTGIEFDAILDGLDEFITSADSSFEMLAENFEDYMMQALLHIVKTQYLTSALQGWYDEFSKRMEDSELSEADRIYLENLYKDIAQEGKRRYDAAKELAGIEDRFDSNLTGISKGISNITEDTALVLGGYLDSIRLKLFQYIDMMMADELPFVSKMLLAQSQMVGYLASIDANTKRSANASANLAENIGKVMVAESDGWKLNVKV